jgi:hypothetical protein
LNAVVIHLATSVVIMPIARFGERALPVPVRDAPPQHRPLFPLTIA